jgi:4-hydroxy-tetrahydrodipicolinate synthase
LAVARSTRLPILVYNIPGRTAVNILPSTLVRIAKAHRNVIAVKEASGNVDQVSEIVSLTRKELPGFTVLAGDDSLALPMMAVGARGVVSVLSNIAPRHVASLCSAFLKGDAAKAKELHLKALPLIKALFVETNPIPVKAALEFMGLCSAAPRLPLTPITPPARAALKKQLQAFGLI